MEIIEAGRFDAPEGLASYVEHLRVATMSVGTYSLPAGSVDDQSPHAEDEVYVVVAGRGRFTAGPTADGTKTVDVVPGTVLFVPKLEQHRFHDVTEDLEVLVVFAPPYSGVPDVTA